MGEYITEINQFTDLLNHEEFKYNEILTAMLERNEQRLTINIDHMRKHYPELTAKFLSKPIDFITLFQNALTTRVKTLIRDMINSKELDGDLGDDIITATQGILPPPNTRRALMYQSTIQYYLGFEGSFGSYHVTPRGLKASFISHMVCVEGIVTKCSLVRPKVIKSVHYCEATGETSEMVYADQTSDTGIPTTSSYPTKDQKGNPLTTEFGECEYKDSQSISIQEMPERAPAGQLPRSVDILLDNDLVDLVKPGDRVQVVGVYRALPLTPPGTKGATRFRTVLIGNSIKMLSKEISGPSLTHTDIQNIRHFSSNSRSFDLLANSLAPSIFGHSYIKKSLLLLLLGGVEQNLKNGTHLRGDINLLMVGDPSTAKSQLLRFILNIAPLAINTTGRGSSGVGLTAAVTSDSETGERRLEAGAMVLADRGIVCIDEFDKMGHDDRVAIHEVMEQQTVTISKAGIHASLNARCSVVAAANPIYGQYNRFKKPHENIALPDSLLSRFDLLFIVLDQANPDHDRLISEHILRMHRYRNPNENEVLLHSEPTSILGGEMEATENNTLDQDVETPVFQKFDKLLHGSHIGTEILSIPFIQKYIFYAKSKFKPKLTDDAREHIIKSFIDLRTREEEKTLPITTRSLETLIRLSEAHAKARLSNKVEKQDAEVALEILTFALTSEAKPVPKPRKEKSYNNNNNNNKNNEDEEEEEEELDIKADGANKILGKRKTRNNNINVQHLNEDEEQDDSENDENNNNANNTRVNKKTPANTSKNTKTKTKPTTSSNIPKRKRKDEEEDYEPDDEDMKDQEEEKIDIVKKLGEAKVKKFGAELNRLLGSPQGRDLDVAKAKKLLKAYDKGSDFDNLLQHWVEKERKIYISKDGRIKSLLR